MKRKIQTGKKLGKLVAAAMAAAFVFMSASTVSAEDTATEVEPSTVADLVDILDGEGESEPVGTPVVMEDGSVMYECNIEDLDTPRMKTVYDLVQGGEGTQTINTVYRTDWEIEPNTRHVSPEYWMTKGQYIAASCIVTPTDKDFKHGFMDDEGHAWYVPGKGVASFDHVVPATDWYRVFIQNDYKSTKLASVGGFKYYNRK